MKLKFINFRRLGAGYEDPAYVPEELIRKNWSLYAAEFFSFAIGLVLIWVNAFEIFESGIENNILGFSLRTLGLLLMAGSLCCGLENHWYRIIMSLSHALLIVLFAITAPSVKIALAVLIPSIIIILLLNFNAKNIAYYRWCKLLNV
jgi:hypothetical protein